MFQRQNTIFTTGCGSFATAAAASFQNALPTEVTAALAGIKRGVSEAGAALADVAMIDMKGLHDVSKTATTAANSTASYLLFGRKASDMDDEDNGTFMSSVAWTEPRALSVTAQSRASETADCCIDSPRSANAAVLDLSDATFARQRSVDMDRFEYI